MLFNKKWLTAKYGPDFPGVKAEIERLTNQRHLQRIAKEAESYELQMIAVRKIEDQRVLIKIAMTDAETAVRICALNRIVSKDARLEIAVSIIEDVKVSDYYRVDAIKAIINEYPQAQEHLRSIIARADTKEILRSAELIDDKDVAQAAFRRVVLESKYTSEKMQALEHIRDDAYLIDIINREDDGEVSLKAADRISEETKRQSAFRDIANNTRIRLKERYEAAVMISDEQERRNALKDILLTAEARVEQKSGSNIWHDKEMISIVEKCRTALNGLG
ncbi:hypothetical protein SAMN02910456_00098 [Ruminococcaceae bacterium YRB3002]|nr:hypothetical protein SAMN02910456_00098 [Ruminococcaceae bacterium YRB3002]